MRLEWLKKVFWGVVVLGVLVAGTRYPMHQDEAVFIEVAEGINQGKLPYQDFSDNKPPGIYYLLAIWIRWWGNSLLAIRSLVIGVNLISAVGVWLICRDWLVTMAFLILMPAYQGQFGLTEVFMLPWLIFGVKSSLSITDGDAISRWWATGSLFGIAWLFKQTAVLTGLAMIFYLMFAWRRRVQVLGYFALGGVSWPAMIVLGLSHWIDIDKIWYWLITFYWQSYPAANIDDVLTDLPRLIMPLGIFHLLLLHNIYVHDNRNVTRAMLWICLFSIPVLLFRPYHHYWIQFLPFYLILAFNSLAYPYCRYLLKWQLLLQGVWLNLYPWIIY